MIVKTFSETTDVSINRLFILGETTSTKKKIIKIIKDVTKAYKKEGDDIVEYELKSYFGVSPKGNLTDPAYIQYRTKNNIQFANDMAAGKYGRLD